jgi:N-acetylmuramoyl-L-alanine amidase
MMGTATMTGCKGGQTLGAAGTDAALRHGASGLTVVLDPGHGGHDSGAVGPAGTREAAVNLAVAIRMRACLEEAGVRAAMTRRADVYIPLRERVEQANLTAPAAFVSIHCNAANRVARGTETYYFRGSRQGEALAGCLQHEVLEALPGVGGRGVKPAGYYVLRRTLAPAALVELEFIDTHGGEALLRSPRVQELLGRALALGVVEYLGRRGTLPADSPGGAAWQLAYGLLAACGRRDAR